MANDQQRTEDDGGLSRRQVLARGAVVAGVVWAAPVIRTASAYATSAAGTERPCSKFYLVCIDQLGARPVRFREGDEGYDEMPADSVIAKFRPILGPAPTTTTSTTSTSTTTTSSTSSTTTSSTSSTTTSSTSTTSTTSTTKPFKDPTDGLGLFPGDEANADPRDKDKKKKDKDKKKKGDKSKARDQDPDSTTTTTTDPNAVPDDATDPPALDDLGLFPDETPVDPAATTPDIGFDTLPPGIERWLSDNSGVPVRYPDVPPMLTNTGEEAWAVLLPPVEDGPNPDTHQCRAVKGWAHANSKYGEYYVDSNLDGTDEENLRLLFPNPTMDDTNPGLIDNLFLVYCCP
jgi:hypothetical protein